MSHTEDDWRNALVARQAAQNAYGAACAELRRARGALKAMNDRLKRIACSRAVGPSVSDGEMYMRLQAREAEEGKGT